MKDMLRKYSEYPALMNVCNTHENSVW